LFGAPHATGNETTRSLASRSLRGTKLRVVWGRRSPLPVFHSPLMNYFAYICGKIRAMKRLKIYLDTSVISYLDQQDALERMAETHILWDKIKNGEFKAVISDITLSEINDCAEIKKNILFEYLAQINYELIETNENTLKIAGQFVNFGILQQKSFDDCQHIAAAIVSECDIIVSWNFKHIVNHKTMMGVKAITALEGFNDVLIYAPSILTGGE
jgi:predicted nucleic acid-binding protein